MDTSAISTSGTSADAAGAAAATTRNALGKDDFLKLLTAQLANQDPLQPVDNQAFIAQLAQFSSVEQLQNLSSRLDTLLVATASSNQMSTTSLVGKTVSFKADGVDLAGGAPSSLAVTLPARATVTAVVQDASGRTVRTFGLGTHDAGSFDLGWDGRGDGGATLPDGHYSVTLTAKGTDGAAVTATAAARGRVSGVSFASGAAELIVGGARVKLADVSEITQP